jgi:hypothetical protein
MSRNASERFVVAAPGDELVKARGQVVVKGNREALHRLKILKKV